MGIEHESHLDHPVDTVWDWHARPGAMPRLVPPWQPMTVVREAESLADGVAVLGLPGGLRGLVAAGGQFPADRTAPWSRPVVERVSAMAAAD